MLHLEASLPSDFEPLCTNSSTSLLGFSQVLFFVSEHNLFFAVTSFQIPIEKISLKRKFTHQGDGRHLGKPL